MVRELKKACGINLSGVEVGELRPGSALYIIFYHYHTFLMTLRLFVDIEMVIFISLERRLIHSVFYWTFLPYSGYQSHATFSAFACMNDPESKQIYTQTNYFCTYSSWGYGLNKT